MKNSDIYTHYTQLYNNFHECQELLPIKLNFAIQKNLTLMEGSFKALEISKLAIYKKYGTPTDENDGTVFIPKENLEKAQNDMDELMDLDQEIQIRTVHFSDIPDDVKLTSQQMAALIFMIEDDE